MGEANHNQHPIPHGPEVAAMTGDGIIVHPDVDYDTVAQLEISPEQAWSGRFGVTRMGEVGKGYAGLLLPQRFDPILNEALRSLPIGADEPKRLSVGDVITDGKGDVVVLEIDDETRTVLFESAYISGSEGRTPMRYTWQIRIGDGATPGTSTMLSRTRMEGLKNPRLGRMLWPRIDKLAANILAEGISRDDEKVPEQSIKRRIGSAALAAAGKVLDYKRSRSRRHG